MPQSHRQLTAVMFTDVVGYSALVHADEAGARRMMEWHNRMLRRQLHRHGGRHIESNGDGNLAIFDSALAAAHCAVALQQVLAQRNATVPAAQALRLRIGLHQGDIERRRGRVYGDGVNVGARLEPLSPPGGIAASAMVVSQIHGPLRRHFLPTGAKALKNIAEPVEVFALDAAAVQAAAAEVPLPSLAARLPRGLLRIGAAIALVAVVAAGLGLRERFMPAATDTSLAILPLENLSTEPGSAEFVGGLHDSLLTELSRLPQLRVISRSSVMRYASQRPGSPELGRQLKVANLIEGSVQRQGSRVRINLQLIDAATDAHLWAEVYDRDIGDLFQLQKDISREVARKIRGNLVLASLPESEQPTRSVAAYDLYLQAIALEDSDLRLGYEPPGEPLRLLGRAVELDPAFALAHAARARFAVWGAHWASYSEPAGVAAFVAEAEAAASRAMALDAALPESLLAMALAHTWTRHDLRAAQSLLQEALRRRPGYARALYLLSGIEARLGDVDRSVLTAQALLDVDPNNEKAHELLFEQLGRRRDYAAADEAGARWQALSESPAYVRRLRGILHFHRTGELDRWRDALAAPAGARAVAQDLLDTDRWYLAMYEQQFADAAAINRAAADSFAAGHGGNYKWAFGAGQALAAGGEMERARPYLEAAAAYLQNVVTAAPDDRVSVLALSQVQAWLVSREQALITARRGLALAAPAAGERASPGHYDAKLNYAQICAHFGLRDEALLHLREVLEMPSGVHAHALLRDPLWAPLNRDPAFQKLVRARLPA